MAFIGSTKKYLELKPMNRNECDLRSRPDDLVGLDEITEVMFDVRGLNHESTLTRKSTYKEILLSFQ